MLVACSVPVVVLFTKFDALLAVALGKLVPSDRRLPPQERLSKAQALVEGIFNRADVWGRLTQRTHAPKSWVQIGGLCYVLHHTHTRSHCSPFPGMHKSIEGCSKLLETTAIVLNQEALQMLLYSAQEVNMGLCVKYAVQKWVSTSYHAWIS